jgi:hypothetical protein
MGCTTSAVHPALHPIGSLGKSDVQFSQVVPESSIKHTGSTRNDKSQKAVNKAWQPDDNEREDKHSQKSSGESRGSKRKANATKHDASNGQELLQPIRPESKSQTKQKGRTDLDDNASVISNDERAGLTVSRVKSVQSQSQEEGMTRVATDKHTSTVMILNKDEDLLDPPKNAVSIKSYFHEPADADFDLGIPIPPCAPSQRGHVKRLEKALRLICRDPKGFQDYVLSQRERSFSVADGLKAVTDS